MIWGWIWKGMQKKAEKMMSKFSLRRFKPFSEIENTGERAGFGVCKKREMMNLVLDLEMSVGHPSGDVQ